MTKLDVAHPSLEVAGLSLAGACAAIGLTTMFCSALLVLALAPFTVLLGMGLGLCPPVALAALSGRQPRLLVALTACPMIGAAVAGAAHMLFLSGVDHSHDLRTAAAVVVVWLLLASGFATVFRIALSGKYRQAARRSIQVALALLLLAAVWLVVGSAFEGGQTDAAPTAYAGALTGELAGICLLTGILIAPVALLRRHGGQVTRRESP
jgi:hypothetical protein